MHTVPPRQADRLRRAPAREAEGQALLRRAGAAVPPVLPRWPSARKGNTGEALMSLLERRLDNVVHRLGFGQSRAQARQIVCHGHVTVNGRRVDIPSYLVRPGDVIRVKNRAKSLRTGAGQSGRARARGARFPRAAWPATCPKGTCCGCRRPATCRFRFRPQLIVELCSQVVGRRCRRSVDRPLIVKDRRILMRIRWRGLELPSQVACDTIDPDRHLRQVRRRAVRARLRRHRSATACAASCSPAWKAARSRRSRCTAPSTSSPRCRAWSKT